MLSILDIFLLSNMFLNDLFINEQNNMIFFFINLKIGGSKNFKDGRGVGEKAKE